MRILVPLALLLAGCFAAGPSLGVTLGRDNETRSVVVQEVAKGRAGDLAGLQKGDEVLMIDGVYVRDLEAKEIKAKLHGSAETTLALTVVRGGEVRHLHLKRGASGQRPATEPKETKISE